MESFVKILQIIFDIFQVGAVLVWFFQYKPIITYKKTIGYVALFITLITATEIWYQEALYVNRGLILCMVMPFLFMEKNAHNRIWCAFMGYYINAILDALFMALIRQFSWFPDIYFLQSIIMDTLSTIMIVTIALLWRRFSLAKFSFKEHKHSGILICIIIIFTLLLSATPMHMTLSEIQGSKKLQFVFVIICYCVVGGALLLMFYIVKNDSYKLNEKINEEKNRLLSNYYSDILKNSEEIRKFRHDYKNHLRSIKYLTDKQDYDKLRSYLDEIEHSSLLENHTLDVGNDFVSAILNDYVEKAKLENIIISIQGRIPYTEIINETDWCIIFTNSINNALEACRALNDGNEKQISVNLRQLNHQLLIELQNPIATVPTIINGQMHTTKSDKFSHGLGIKNIQQTIEKYHGNLSYEVSSDQNSLHTRIILPVSNHSS